MNIIPVHIHQGKLFTGLSSVMILKLPKETGVEYSAEDKPMNGRLQIIGAAAGQFSKTDYSPEMKIGDFYVFPYDMRHCVYPFNGTKETRRTLVCNVDVDYNPVASRTGSGQSELPIIWYLECQDGNLMLPQPQTLSLHRNNVRWLLMLVINVHQKNARVGGGDEGKYDTKKRVTTISWIPFR